MVDALRNSQTYTIEIGRDTVTYTLNFDIGHGKNTRVLSPVHCSIDRDGIVKEFQGMGVRASKKKIKEAVYANIPSSIVL